MKKEFKRFMFKLAKNHVFSILMAVLLVLFCYSLLSSTYNMEELTFNVIVEMLGGWLAAVGAVSLVFVEKRIENQCEDSEKLTDDYAALAKKYRDDNLIRYRNGDEDVPFPVVLVGEIADIPADDPSRIRIADDPEDMYTLPSMLEKHFTEIFAAHSASTVYNNRNIRAIDMHLDQDSLMLRTGRTTYYNSLTTNRAMDWSWRGTSVRELYEFSSKLTPLAQSMLSNHLGFNGFVESSDGNILFIKRKKNLSIGKNTYGDSIGASMKAKYALNSSGLFTPDGLMKAIIGEICDELQLVPNEIFTDSLRIIACYRDCVEGGKPQFLFFGKIRVDSRVVDGRLGKHVPRGLLGLLKTPFKGWLSGLTQLTTITDGSKTAWIRRVDIENERLRIYPDRVEGSALIDGRERRLRMNMVPSASASVVILVQYFKSLLALREQDELRVVEKQCIGKQPDQRLCEDGLVITPDLVAVIDGVTAKGSHLWNGKSSGAFARDVIADFLQGAALSHFTAQSLFEQLDLLLQQQIRRESVMHPIETADYPRASVVLFSRCHREVWNYGDCICKIGGTLHEHKKEVDSIIAALRSMIDEAELAKETSPHVLMENDTGRAEIAHALVAQFLFENRMHPLGYPVLNGTGICPEFIRVYQTAPGQTVILASDGYPEVMDTLAESEACLEKVLREDPLCIRLFPSTKGLRKGNLSFDDRTYCRFVV